MGILRDDLSGGVLRTSKIKYDKLTSVFYASVLLLKVNFVISSSKFAAEPQCGSWFHSHFDNVMTQLIINKRTDA